MVVRILSSYRGVLTAQILYEAGDYVVGDTIPADVAEALIEHKRAVKVKPEPKPKKAKPKQEDGET